MRANDYRESLPTPKSSRMHIALENLMAMGVVRAALSVKSKQTPTKQKFLVILGKSSKVYDNNR